MRTHSLYLLLALAACADGGPARLGDESGGPGPELSPGTCGINVSKGFSDPISADANTSQNSNDTWFLSRSNGVGVTIVGDSGYHSGQVTSTSYSAWISFPHTLPSPQVDADVLYSTGSAGSGTVGLVVFFVCSDGTDTRSIDLGAYNVTVN